MKQLHLPISLIPWEYTGCHISPTTLTRQDLQQVLDSINIIWKDSDINLFNSESSHLIPPPDSHPASHVRDELDHIASVTQNAYGLSEIVGLYAAWNGDPNGRTAPLSVKTVFTVKENPSLREVYGVVTNNFTARVSSHEIGHILGLSHFNSPPSEKDRLMFSNPGTNGIRLIPREIAIARAKAEWLLNPHSQ